VVTPQTTDELETVHEYLECTVDEFNDQVELLVIQHGAVAFDVEAQLFNETETSSFVLQCPQHCREYLPVGTHTDKHRASSCRCTFVPSIYQSRAQIHAVNKQFFSQASN